MEKTEKHKYPYEWTLKDANFTKDKGTVFSCFACGGGSTMGYKLAGFDVIGCNEIDPKMMEAYKENHKPKYSYLEPIQTFKLRNDLPKELYNLDILDGSPPCSSFSMAGNREKDWGKEKKFREGQQSQILDNLFFDFIDLAKKLQPKIVIAENVSGLMMGEAKQYVRKIYTDLQNAGYQLKIEPYLLDASTMGVPQIRKRVFFIALRNDLTDPFMEQVDMFQTSPKLEINFNEPLIPFKEIEDSLVDNELTEKQRYWWTKTSIGQPFSSVHPKGHWFNSFKISPNNICPTICAGTGNAGIYHYKIPRKLTVLEYSRCSTFPIDFKYIENKPKYIMGMSVPPVMTAQIASCIYEQWLSKLT